MSRCAVLSRGARIEALLVGRGLDGDFIADLRAKADALENALASAVAETARRVGSTDTAMLAHKQANKIIATVDPIVRKRYRDNPAKLAAWEFASHVQRDSTPTPNPPNNPPANPAT